MDMKRRARQVRPIIQTSEILDVADIKAWLGGGWALVAHESPRENHEQDIVFYIYAQDAAQVRMLLTEAGWSIVEVLPDSFAAERGRLLLRWELLWIDELGHTVTYGNRSDKAYFWPKDAFPPEKTGMLAGVAVRVVSAAAWGQYVLDGRGDKSEFRQKNTKDLSRLKSLVHDRM